MLESKHVGSNIVINLKGRLDVYSSASTENEINKLIEKNSGDNVVINMNDVEYISSTGLRIMIAIQTRLQERGRTFHLCFLNSNVAKTFEVVGLIDIFDIYGTEEDAVQFDYTNSLLNAPD
ncbi:MAG: STAS domain-containing protein [Spirochaetia bacterium]|nr:STAS domain-containing protein [Spirochaetia bacterium]